MQVSIDNTGGDLPNFPHMRTELFPPGLLRQPLWDGHHRDQYDGGGQARNEER